MTRSLAAAVGVITSLVLFAGGAAAQDPRYERLDPDTRARVSAVIDSARTVGLPTEPLIQRALEGVLKGAGSNRIVAAVRRLAVDLGVARSALGSGASSAELAAGVAALRAGATPTVLAHLRERRHQSLTVALAVLADLTARGVPVDSAARHRSRRASSRRHLRATGCHRARRGTRSTLVPPTTRHGAHSRPPCSG